MANTVISLRKSATPAAVPTNLSYGELAINYADGKLFYKDATNAIKSFEADIPAVADSFGTVNAAGTLIVADTSGDIINLEAGDNIVITGNVLTDTIRISATGNVTSTDLTAVYNHANSAYDKANNALANTTGTFGGTLTISNDLVVIGNTNIDSGSLYVDATNNRVGIGTTTPSYKLEIVGSFAATTKSFVIDHPTKKGMKLRYGSLEGPENGVYIRGRITDSKTIDLPDYWHKLVDKDSITVSLTPIGKTVQPSVGKVTGKKITLIGDGIDCFYLIFAERKDVEKLLVEI